MQSYLKDPTKWSSWGSGGTIIKAREKDKDASGNKLPMVSVLLPVKGVHAHTLMHWRSQIKASHGGQIEFIFCMESEEDPAYAAALDFRRECGDSAVITIVSCGLSFYCSQKIHNLLKAVTLVNKDSDYVLFLDDDAQMSSTILSDLVYTLETDAEVLIASGWPHDYFPPDLTMTPTFASFMLLGYRLLSHLSMGTLYPTVLWGGCMLMRRSELMDPTIGVLEAWKASGYSDDMIVIGRARKFGRKIAIPPTAFLPSRIQQGYTLQQHVNYMRRQMFVCGTYHDTHDRLNNLFLLIVVSMVFVVFGCFNFQFLTIYSLGGILFALVSEPQTLLPTAFMQPHQCGMLQSSPVALYFAVLAAATLWVYAKLSCYRSAILVCEHVAGRPMMYSNTIGPIRFGVLLFLGVAAQCVVHSVAAAVAFCTNSIVWSGRCRVCIVCLTWGCVCTCVCVRTCTWLYGKK